MEFVIKCRKCGGHITVSEEDCETIALCPCGVSIGIPDIVALQNFAERSAALRKSTERITKPPQASTGTTAS